MAAKKNDSNNDARQPENMDIEILKLIHDHFLQDVREFWSRSNFYLVVHAGLVSVFVSLPVLSSQYLLIVKIALGVFGFLLAIFWLLAMRGAIFWIRLWRKKLIELDELIDPYKAIAKTESQGISSPLLSPSFITAWLPLLFVIGWLVLIINSLINV